jgi:hypothetical protein
VVPVVAEEQDLQRLGSFPGPEEGGGQSDGQRKQ